MKSALSSSGYGDLTAIKSMESMEYGALTQNRWNKQQSNLRSVHEMEQKKALPLLIGLHSNENNIELNDGADVDTENESLYDNVHSKEATPTSTVSTPRTPRTFKAKTKHKKKGKG